ncbi:hypothetical protein RFI_33723, partial [Reticulomyxa filosa]
MEVGKDRELKVYKHLKLLFSSFEIGPVKKSKYVLYCVFVIEMAVILVCLTLFNIETTQENLQKIWSGEVVFNLCILPCLSAYEMYKSEQKWVNIYIKIFQVHHFAKMYYIVFICYVIAIWVLIFTKIHFIGLVTYCMSTTLNTLY